MSFTFGGGSSTTGGGGFNFGTNSNSTTNAAASGGFSFGSKTTATTSTGFTLGTSTASSGGGGLSFGTASTKPTAGAFNFGGTGQTQNTTTTAAATFSLAAASKPTAVGNATEGTTSLGSMGFTPAGNTGLALGATKPTGVAIATTTTAAGGFTLGGGLKLGGTVTTASSTGTTQAAAAAAPVNLGAAKPSTTGLALGSAGGTSAAGGFKLGSTQSSTLGQGFKLGTAPTTTSTTTSLLTAPTTTTATATVAATLSTATSTTASGTTAPTMNYRQLEEAINKWTIELEDQEKIFLQQATQVNAWDRLLIDNGEKITRLNTDVERVKIDQQRLDHELDFILAQQGELEALLGPLEKSIEQLPPINYQQHANPEREHTYQLAENIDAQLKRMVQDLKEIIDHLNTSNSSQDNNDPVHQIAKILNAHMDSLQWVDQNTSLLQRRVEEVSKSAEQRRKEQERNFRLAYD